MKPAHLYIVADNTNTQRRAGGKNGNGVAKAQANLVAIARWMRYGFAFAIMVLGLPFRFVAAVCRFAVATGRALFNAVFTIVIGTIGLAVLVLVGYGLFRVIFHPLFH